MRLRKLTPLLLAACLVAGCGSDEEPKPSIPGESADALLAQLGSIRDRFEFGDGACNDIAENERDVNDIISRLPASVDSDVRNALQDSFDHLFDLTSDQCDKSKGQDTDTETDTTETTQTQTTETETTPTTETETETTTETAPPTETDTTPTTPPDTEGDGEGGGAEGPGL